MDIDIFDGLFDFAVVIGMTVSAWIVTRQVRLRMSKTLGKTPSDLEMASLKTWMQVDEAEQRDKQRSSIHPS
jgi:hypothetical protein